jgi:hypothetical protein
LAAVLLVSSLQPLSDVPTQAQRTSAELAARDAAVQVAQMKVVEAQNANNWNMLFTALITGGGLSAIGAWVLNYKNAVHKQAMESAQLAAELKAREKDVDGKSDNAVIVSMRDEISRLGADNGRLHEQVNALQGQLNRQAEQLLWLQMHGNESPFIGWSVDTSGIVTHITAAFERQILNPLNMTRGQVIGKKHAEIWPKQLADAIAALDDAARTNPDHSAWAENVIFDPRLPPFGVGKTVLRFHDRPIGLSGCAMSMKSKVTIPTHR